MVKFHHRHSCVVLTIVLLLSVFTLTACGWNAKSTPVSKAGSETSVTEPAAVTDTGFFTHPVMEYGTSDAILDNGLPMYTYLHFPRTGIAAIDDEIYAWAVDLYQNSLAEIVALQKTDTEAEGELNIQYQSWKVNARYVGIAEAGDFQTNQLAHPTDVSRTFNVDLSEGKILNNDEIIDPAQQDAVLSLLREQVAARYPDLGDIDIDASWLGNLTLNHEGVAVLLERGVYLPSYLGLQLFTLAYEDLGSALLIDPSDNVAAPAVDVVAPTEPVTSPVTPPGGAAVDPSRPMVALSFDDGPSQYTSQILDLLEQNNGRATFCVLGNLVDSRKEVVQRASAQGCDVIGHSWDHKQLTKLSTEELTTQLTSTRDIIESVTGKTSTLYRPPYGAVNDTVKSVSRDLGLSLINWSVDTLDWKTRNADSVYNAIMRDTKNGSIVLCHDLYASTADAMARVIPELTAQGYQLVTVSELLSYTGVTVEPGNVYSNGKTE